METTRNIMVGDTVLYPECHNDVFKVVGVREKELELVGDFSGIGHEQKSWVPAEKLTFHKAIQRGNAKLFLEQLWNQLWVLDYVLTRNYSEDEVADRALRILYQSLVFGETLVVSAFPGTGKSHFVASTSLNCLDSDSSKFDKSDFPANYIRHIQANIGKVDVIFVSSHKVVRDALVEARIPYVLAYPNAFAKEEYLERYKKRGSPEGFIKLISDNWTSWLDETKNQLGCFKVCMPAGKYLSDYVSDPYLKRQFQ